MHGFASFASFDCDQVLVFHARQRKGVRPSGQERRRLRPTSFVRVITRSLDVSSVLILATWVRLA